MYYTQIQSNLVAGYLTSGLDGFTNYTATPGQLGFPTCLQAPCVPVLFDPKTLPPSQLPARNITIRAGRADFYRQQFAQYGLNFDLLPNYPDKLVNPRSQVVSIGAEREIRKGLFAGADYVHQHWTDLDRSVDLNAPSVFDRTAPGQVRTRGGGQRHPSDPAGQRRRSLGQRADEPRRRRLRRPADAGELPRQREDLRAGQLHAVEGDQHDRAGRQRHRAEREHHVAARREERGPSVLDQRHRAVITFTYLLPYNITAGTVTQLASSRPFNATTGIDNNGDGANNDRPVVERRRHRQVGVPRHRDAGCVGVRRGAHQVRRARRSCSGWKGSTCSITANILGRAQTIYGDTTTVNNTFGQLVAVGTATNALPALANIDPPRFFQFQARFSF